MRFRLSCLLVLMTVTFVGLAGCGGGGGSTTVQPADAEKVAPDAPVSEEKPSSDEG